jgi:hypothetical protein
MLIGAPVSIQAGSEDMDGFNAMDGGPSRLLIAVGDFGAIAHFSQTDGWRPMDSGTHRDLHDVHVISEHFAVAVGTGIVIKWNGERWDTLLEEEPDRAYNRIWASADQDSLIFSGNIAGRSFVCPWIIGSDRQPFCRRFVTSLAGVCGDGDEFNIVLSNGDVYEVNSALMSKDGTFEPTSVSENNIELLTAVNVGRSCKKEAHEPKMIAISKDRGLWAFKQGRWLPLNMVSPDFLQDPEARAALVAVLTHSRM